MIVASVQCDFVLNDLVENTKRVRNRLKTAIGGGARLVVFPECALSGYCHESRDEAFEGAIDLSSDHPSISAIVEDCRAANVYVIVGLLERAGSKIYNTAICLGPNGIVSRYRKLHLPFLGVDRYVDPGDLPLEVFEVDGLRVGMHICYDGGFPELARSMTIQGADLITLPTCWPPAADIYANHVPIARSLENQVYMLASGRAGGERGYTFIGHSSIVAPGGFLLASAGFAADTIIYADIEPEKARRKRVIRIPGIHEIDRIADRRPEFYGEVVKPNTKWPRYQPGGPVRDDD